MKRKYIPALSFFVAIFALFSFSEVFALGGVGGMPLKPLDNGNRGWFMYKLDPGESYDDVLLVRNTTKKDWFVDIYPADQTPSSGGGFALKQKSEEMTEMGSWIKLSKDRVFVEAGGTTKVPFTVTVPKDVEMGETAGAIMMEKVDPKSLQKARQMLNSGVRLSLRTGVRIYNIVQGEIKEEIKIKDSFFQEKIASGWKKGPVYFFSQHVENRGTISTKAKFIVKVKDLWRDEIIYDTREDPGEFLISPEDTFEYNQDLQLPKFGKFEVSSEVYMEDRTGGETFIGTQNQLIFVLPKKEIIAGLLVIIIFVILVIWRRWKYSGKGWVDYTVKTGDTIVSVADKAGVDWEFLARVNRLKSPYALRKGEKIIIPPKKRNNKE